MDKLFDFKPKYKKGKIGREQLRHARKEYPHACERCGGHIHIGDLYVAVSEYRTLGDSYYAQRYETHRLCESCLEEIVESKKQEIRPFNRAELQSLLGEVVVENLTRNQWVVEGLTIDNDVVINGQKVSAIELVEKFTYKNEPCGIKE